MRTTRLTLRLDTRLADILRRAGGSQKIRAILAAGVGRPELALVLPEGRQRTRPRKKAAILS